MPVLTNPQHEKFALLVARGLTTTKAYVWAGFSARGARQSAHRLLANADVARATECGGALCLSFRRDPAAYLCRACRRLHNVSFGSQSQGQFQHQHFGAYCVSLPASKFWRKEQNELPRTGQHFVHMRPLGERAER
jgi:hypothetical protein